MSRVVPLWAGVPARRPPTPPRCAPDPGFRPPRDGGRHKTLEDPDHLGGTVTPLSVTTTSTATVRHLDFGPLTPPVYRDHSVLVGPIPPPVGDLDSKEDVRRGPRDLREASTDLPYLLESGKYRRPGSTTPSTSLSSTSLAPRPDSSLWKPCGDLAET